MYISNKILNSQLGIYFSIIFYIKVIISKCLIYRKMYFATCILFPLYFLQLLGSTLAMESGDPSGQGQGSDSDSGGGDFFFVEKYYNLKKIIF